MSDLFLKTLLVEIDESLLFLIKNYNVGERPLIYNFIMSQILQETMKGLIMKIS